MNIAQSLVERFWLGASERSARERSRAAQEAIAHFYRIGIKLKEGADLLADSQEHAAALCLYRDAAAHLSVARLFDVHGGFRVEHVTAERALRALSEASAPLPREHEQALARLTDDELIGARHAPDGDDLGERVAEAREACTWLAGATQHRSAEAVRFMRLLHVVGVLLLVSLVAYVATKRARLGTNIGTGKPVFTSSRAPGTPDPAGITNGTIEPGFAAHTRTEPDAHITVDLGQTRQIREVRVHPRGDGYLQELVPQTLEVSPDGIAYYTVGVRQEQYSQTSPWVLRPEVAARFVRVRRTGHGYLALSEIEIFGK